MPEAKQGAIEQLSRNERVGMVSNGINDLPALARADIGFAIGATGTGTAIVTADVAMMDADLRKIPTFLRISRATIRWTETAKAVNPGCQKVTHERLLRIAARTDP